LAVEVGEDHDGEYLVDTNPDGIVLALQIGLGVFTYYAMHTMCKLLPV
jgi:hypothetical protein